MKISLRIRGINDISFIDPNQAFQLDIKDSVPW